MNAVLANNAAQSSHKIYYILIVWDCPKMTGMPSQPDSCIVEMIWHTTNSFSHPSRTLIGQVVHAGAGPYSRHNLTVAPAPMTIKLILPSLPEQHHFTAGTFDMKTSADK